MDRRLPDEPCSICREPVVSPFVARFELAEAAGAPLPVPLRLTFCSFCLRRFVVHLMHETRVDLIGEIMATVGREHAEGVEARRRKYGRRKSRPPEGG
jgi:hypothetical protein